MQDYLNLLLDAINNYNEAMPYISLAIQESNNLFFEFTKGFNRTKTGIYKISLMANYLGIKQNLNMKTTISKTYPLTIYFNNKRKLSLTGFVDTGNKLRDPITKKWVILVNKKLLKGVVRIRTPIYVPYHSLNNKGLVECIKPEKMVIEGREYTNFLIGLMDSKIMINSSDCILNLEILEELNV